MTQIRWHLKETSLSGPQLGGQTDGFLCCQYCLRLLRQDPSRQHGHKTSPSRNTRYHCPQLSHQTSLQMVTKPENHSLLRKEKRDALTMQEDRIFLSNCFIMPSVPLHCGQLAWSSNGLDDRVTLSDIFLILLLELIICLQDPIFVNSSRKFFLGIFDKIAIKHSKVNLEFIVRLKNSVSHNSNQEVSETTAIKEMNSKWTIYLKKVIPFSVLLRTI